MTKTALFLVCGMALAGAAYTSVGAQTPATVNDGIYTTAQADRGKKVYDDNCAGCHGPELKGTDTGGPTLNGPDFISGYKDGNASALYNKISMDMPSNAPGSLNPDQYADVLAYVLSVNKYPAGQTEIPKDGAGLNAVKMATPKA
ncbi:MAG TPA: cytochrome c [Vicinamibacterales bacterium]|nr:cytochrome c [Vicinamibacterales bacterium]